MEQASEGDVNHRLPEDALIEALSTGDLVPETAPRQAAPVGVSVGTAESREPGLAGLADDAGAAEELLEIAVGPHHPSTHGVFRMDVALDGERVVRLRPVFGYLHRNHEKLGERGTYLAAMPYTDRLDYFCSLTNNWAYALAVERLAGLHAPERAEFIRVITAELTRVLNHACLVGFLLQELGAMGTPIMYAFREREKILDLLRR